MYVPLAGGITEGGILVSTAGLGGDCHRGVDVIHCICDSQYDSVAGKKKKIEDEWKEKVLGCGRSRNSSDGGVSSV